jgi:hypothetical protein
VLPRRFHRAIELASKRAELTDVHSFTEQWRRTSTPCAEATQAVARESAASLESQYSEARLRSLIRRGGLAEGPELDAARPSPGHRPSS